MNRKFSEESRKERDRELIRAIALGKSSLQIVDALGWTLSQVNNGRTRVCKLTAMQNDREMTLYALAVGIVTVDELLATIPVIPL